jgi:hypothetical protein
LLVLGLQEAPKSGVAQVLQEAMADTHMWGIFQVNIFYQNTFKVSTVFWNTSMLVFRLLCQKNMQSLHMYLFGAKSSESYIRGDPGSMYEYYWCWKCFSFLKINKVLLFFDCLSFIKFLNMGRDEGG